MKHSRLSLSYGSLITISIIVMGLFCLSRGSFGLAIPHSIWFVVLGGALSLALFSYFKRIIKLSRMTILLVIALMLVYYNNWDFKNGIFADAYYFSIIIVLSIAAQYYSKWHKPFLIFLTVMGLFYASWTYVCAVDENIYYNVVLPFLRTLDPTAPRGNFTFGLTTHYSTNGMYLALALIVTLSVNLVLTKKDKKRLFYLFLSLLLTGGVLLSGKRGIVIVALLSFSLTYILKSRSLDRPAKLLILLSGVLLIAYIASFWIPRLSIIVDRFQNLIAEGNIASDRFDLWAEGFKGFLESPFFGNGWSWFRYHNSFGVIYHVHNCYIQWLCELGLVFAAPIYALIIFATYRAYKLYRMIITDKAKLTGNLYQDQLIRIFTTFAFMYEIYFIIFMAEGTGYYEIQSNYAYFMCIAIVEYYMRAIRNRGLR